MLEPSFALAQVSNGAAWIPPKVAFSNPEVTKILGRVSDMQMKADRDIPLNSALQVIRNDPTALEAPSPAAKSAASAAVD